MHNIRVDSHLFTVHFNTMCGRFTQTKSREEIIEALGGIELPPLFHRRYNIAPTQTVAALRQDAPGTAVECVWGFANPRSGAPIINARAESLVERPMFKGLLKENRCLVPADGFYEWKGKQPYYFQLADRLLFAFAAIWQNARCVIITRAADGNMRGIHDRMPVIFRVPDFRNWLDGFVIPDIPPPLTARPVSRRVNSTAHDDPDCLIAPDVQIDLSLFPDDD